MSKEVQQQLEEAGIIPVLRARSASEAMAVVEAMVAGGITVIEVTMTVPGAIDVLKELKRVYGSKLLLGSGTVTDGAECAATIEAGAEFVVSPSLHMDVIQETKARGKVSLPGANAHRSNHCVAGRRGLRQGVSLLSDGWGKLFEIAQGSISLLAIGAYWRSNARDRRQLSGSRRLGPGRWR
jgi:2-keto-3-deoxy-6-phosphogluconate aldolase